MFAETAPGVQRASQVPNLDAARRVRCEAKGMGEVGECVALDWQRGRNLPSPHADTRRLSFDSLQQQSYTASCVGNERSSTRPPGRPCSTSCKQDRWFRECGVRICTNLKDLQCKGGLTCCPFPTMPKCCAVPTAILPCQFIDRGRGSLNQLAQKDLSRSSNSTTRLKQK
jgi:hypothetical protein